MHASPAPSRPISVDREVLVQIVGYAGSAAALAATFVALGRAEDLTEGGTLLVMLAVVAALFLAGLWIGRIEVPPYERMRSVLWFGAVEAWALAAQLFVTEILEMEGRGSVVLGSALVTAVAALLWWVLRRSLQQLFLYLALLGLIVALIFPVPGPFEPPALTATAVVVWFVGCAWAFLGVRGLVAPPRTAIVLGALTAIVAPLGFTEARLAGEVLALATACAFLVLAEPRTDRAVGGIGIVGVLIVSAVIVVEHLGSSTGGTIAALVVGVALLAGALVAARAVQPPAATGLPPAPPG